VTAAPPLGSGAAGGPAGLIGAIGARAAARVLDRAQRAGWSAVSDGDLAFAAAGPPPAGVGDRAVTAWLCGRLDPDAHAGPPSARLARAARELAAGDPAGVAALRGVYVLVARDSAQRVVWLCHDHRGGIPLHYARAADGFVFAEQPVDLLGLLERTPSPDRQAVVQWIARRALPPRRTLFSGVRRLSAGDGLRIDARDVSGVAVWRPRYREPAPSDASALAERVAEAAFDAVGRAIAGAERPGLRLSGGLDSACLAAGVARAAPGRALALTRTFPGFPSVDEAALTRQSAAATGLELVALPYAETSLLGPMQRYARRWMLPAPSPNLAIAPPLHAEARARGIDLILDGEGGDELFGTWPALIADALRRGDVATAWRLASRLPYIGSSPGRRHRLSLLAVHGVRGALPGGPRRGLEWLDVARSPAARGLVRRRDAVPLARGVGVPVWPIPEGPLWWQQAIGDLIDMPSLLDAHGTVARNASDASLPAAHPFMHDVTLLETMLAVDPAAGFQGARDRGVLRDGLAGQIAEPIRRRYSKSFFNDVSMHQLAGADGEALRRELRAADAPLRAYVREQGLAEVIDARETDRIARVRHANLLFRLGAVNLWLRALEGNRTE
jgi:asparagine synthetase B (glutamine-hydrolysing)